MQSRKYIPYKKKKKDTIPQEINTLKRKFAKMERAVEEKYSDTSLSGPIRATVGATQGELILLNYTQQDPAAQFGRIGQNAIAKKLEMSLLFETGNTPVTDFPIVCRAILLWDKGAQGNYPMLYNTGVGSAVQSILDNRIISRITYAPINHNARNRFKVLWDKRFIVTPMSSQTGIVGLKLFEKTFDLKNKLVEFNDTSFGNINDMSTNTLILAVMNDSGADDAIFGIRSRFWYTDQ